MADNYAPFDAPLDYDPLTGVYQTFHMSHDGQLTIKTDQDPRVLAQIRKLAHEELGSKSKSERIGEWQKVASIPISIQYDLIKRGIWRDKDRMKRWLNSVEAAPWRTHWAKL